jgi:phage terminase large subunit-like protein
MTGNDQHTVVKLYTAPADLDPFDEATIALANPALGTFLNTQEVLAMARNAQRMPSREAEYRNLILNQRVEPSNMFISPAVWKACSTPVSSLAGLTVYGGLDLSEVADLTALVLIAGAMANGMWSRRSGCHQRD